MICLLFWHFFLFYASGYIHLSFQNNCFSWVIELVLWGQFVAIWGIWLSKNFFDTMCMASNLANLIEWSLHVVHGEFTTLWLT